MQYAYPLLAIFIWAGNTVVNKLAVGSIFPAEIGFYRWLLAAVLFTPFMLKPVLAQWPIIRRNLGKIFILGVLGMAVYQSLAYYAATLTSATNMGIILSLMPLMALTAAIITLRQRLTWRFMRRLQAALPFSVQVRGRLPDTPVLWLANHVSWVDIAVLGALRPLSFLAKAEVAAWPRSEERRGRERV